MNILKFAAPAAGILASVIALLAANLPENKQTNIDYDQFDDHVNFFVATDLGRNGYYDQKKIAELMGSVAEAGADPECVVATGDVHHFEGVRSVSDPLWLTNFELVYSHPELMLDWFPMLGNHEYRGSTQAVLDYAGISRRWSMPARYYTKVVEDDDITVRIVCLDTPPIIDKYRTDSLSYPDACRQDYQAQLAWLDSTLAAAKEDWVMVFGHHPIYAQTKKSSSEREDMQQRVDAVLRKHKCVSMYVAGHIHNFQHIRVTGSGIDYITNSSASLSRPVTYVDGTQFASSETGFSIVSASKDELVLRMVNAEGRVLHEVRRTK